MLCWAIYIWTFEPLNLERSVAVYVGMCSKKFYNSTYLQLYFDFWKLQRIAYVNISASRTSHTSQRGLFSVQNQSFLITRIINSSPFYMTYRIEHMVQFYKLLTVLCLFTSGVQCSVDYIALFYYRYSSIILLASSIILYLQLYYIVIGTYS